MVRGSTLTRVPMRRTTDDRVVSGVCGGLAERMRVDAVVVRVGFVLGAAVWGITLVAYGVLWWRLPEVDTPTRNPVRPTRLPALSLGVGSIAVMSGLLLALRAIGLLPPDSIVLPVGLVALGVTFMWAGQPLRPIERPALGAAAAGRAPRTEDESADAEAYQKPRLRWMAEDTPFGTTLVGSLLLVVCVGVLVDRTGVIGVQWRMLGACLLVVIGVTLVVGSTRGRPGGLVGIGGAVLLAVLAATVFQVPLGSGAGARDLRPVQLDDAATRLAGGTLTIDLRALEFGVDGPERLEASVAAGDLRVIVPVGIEVEIEASAGLGVVRLFDDTVAGMSVHQHFRSAGHEPVAGTLAVIAEVGAGRIIVEQQQ